MTLSGNNFGPVHYVLPGEKKINVTWAGLLKSRLIPKNNEKKNRKKYRKIIRLSKVACAEIQAFIILSSRTFNFLVAQSVFSL